MKLCINKNMHNIHIELLQSISLKGKVPKPKKCLDETETTLIVVEITVHFLQRGVLQRECHDIYEASIVKILWPCENRDQFMFFFCFSVDR